LFLKTKTILLFPGFCRRVTRRQVYTSSKFTWTRAVKHQSVVWRPSSARIRLGSLQQFPDIIAELRTWGPGKVKAKGKRDGTENKREKKEKNLRQIVNEKK